MAAALRSRTINEWQQKYQDTKIKVWDLTKVSVDRKDVRTLSETIRSFYLNIEVAFSEQYVAAMSHDAQKNEMQTATSVEQLARKLHAKKS